MNSVRRNNMNIMSFFSLHNLKSSSSWYYLLHEAEISLWMQEFVQSSWLWLLFCRILCLCLFSLLSLFLSLVYILNFIQIGEMEANLKQHENFAVQASLHFENCEKLFSFQFVDIASCKYVPNSFFQVRKRLRIVDRGLQNC